MDAVFVERFWSKVTKTDACWEWAGTRMAFGHGVVWFQGKNRKAHRMAWEITNGPIPDGAWVLHGCDNPCCVNPAHLSLGDAQANTDDRVNRGRSVNLRGARHPNATMDEEAAREVWRLRERGWPESAIAARLGMGRPKVSSILSRHTWAHVAPADPQPFRCPCGSVPDRGRNQHYQTCSAWAAWAVAEEPDLYALIHARQRVRAARMGRALDLLRRLRESIPEPLAIEYGDVLGLLNLSGKDLAAALEAAPR
jgi:hypothetical protein